MKFIRNIFNKQEQAFSHADFWNWFKKNEKSFYKVVKEHGNVEKDFFEKLSPQLNRLKEDCFYYLTGMLEDGKAELVITVEGIVRNVVFAEELVAAAPALPDWKFTALKPPLDVREVTIEMEGHIFSRENMWFYSNDHRGYPDEIDVTIVHRDFNEENKDILTNGVYVFLDNFLGELKFITTIDSLQVTGPGAGQELVPVEKLKDFLLWREKEFIEKYEGIRYNTENDNYTGLEAELENGMPLFAVINTDLLQWDSKASHPWIMTVEIQFDSNLNNGLPDETTFDILDEIENRIMEELKDYDGYLNVGRQTAEGIREIYFACKDFRKPSKVLSMIIEESGNLTIDYEIYKDKYWQTFERFTTY